MPKRFLSIVAATLTWGGCSEPETDWARIPVIEGQQAVDKITAWAENTDFAGQVAFPTTVQWRADIHVKDMPRPLGAPADASATIIMDSTLLGGNRYRSRIVIEIVAADFDNYISIWIESDGEELRLRTRGLDSIGSIRLPFALPDGLRLSADRQDQAVAFVQSLCGSIPGFSQKDSQALLAMSGIGELFHPNNLVRFLGGLASQRSSRWQATSEVVRITFFPLQAASGSSLLNTLEESGLGSSLQQLADLEMTLEFERGSGAFRSLVSSLSYAFEDLPTRGPIQPSLEVSVHMEMRNTQVGAVSFKERDTILDLDNSFDEFWPSVLAAEPLLLQALRDIGNSAAAEDDFSF